MLYVAQVGLRARVLAWSLLLLNRTCSKSLCPSLARSPAASQCLQRSYVQTYIVAGVVFFFLSLPDFFLFLLLFLEDPKTQTQRIFDDSLFPPLGRASLSPAERS
mmetsp:Transcript_5503/g.7771  ORF Transcript_5503/g.7771 Transcript_5503/m.7771 type:complete len:105 (-) Transcript_5503:12-326(-)